MFDQSGDSKWEEARRCPKCVDPGEIAGESRSTGRRGQPVKVISLVCKNKLCLWFETGWVVQVNPDGTIPERDKGPKQFETMSPSAEAFARRTIEQAKIEDPGLGDVDLP